jgi:pimeloyl-ACP methyl ester carboxylesterase
VSEPRSRFFASQRQRLHYLDWGNEQAPLLLLVHGGKDHAHSWDWTAAELARDWHVVAPDLRGHGDSDWAADGNYAMEDFVFDLAELIDQLGQTPLALVGHSLGGNIALRYAGCYPQKIAKLVLIEGLGPSPAKMAEQDAMPMAEGIRRWIEDHRRGLARQPRAYATLDDAIARAQAANLHLSPEQARHLTLHGTRRNADGSLSFKTDPSLANLSPVDYTEAQKHALWREVTCPTLLVYGKESWASNPAEDGRAVHFQNARVELFGNAGHWVQHDRFDAFVETLRAFL